MKDKVTNNKNAKQSQLLVNKGEICMVFSFSI